MIMRKCGSRYPRRRAAGLIPRTYIYIYDLVHQNVLRNHYPVMEHVKAETAVGCALNYLFSPLSITAADWAQYAGMPRDYVAIHARCSDDEFQDGAKADNWRPLVHNALKCAAAMNATNVAFVSCSPTAKQYATQALKESGTPMQIFVASG
eukprot:TRINITY_DN11648_c1_g1_i1.p1 TRINITY_DN11648_c1_g1~~TRINITY_DN11648_c1_g1_i1.p1  ORF type:complete len:151 (-),score=6.11 TRINITY_DN11648_c1_g1_i1:79-531(-)